MQENTTAKPSGGDILSRQWVQATLQSRGESCSTERIGYYPTLTALIEKVRSSRSWSAGEVFVWAAKPERFVIMKQVAPSSCEMATFTESGFVDVITAYRTPEIDLVHRVGGLAEHVEDLRASLGAAGYKAEASTCRAPDGGFVPVVLDAATGQPPVDPVPTQWVLEAERLVDAMEAHAATGGERVLEAMLAERGYRMESSLSELDDEAPALIEIASGEMVDYPQDEFVMFLCDRLLGRDPAPQVPARQRD